MIRMIRKKNLAALAAIALLLTAFSARAAQDAQAGPTLEAAQTLVVQGRFDDAAAMYERIARSNPKDGEARFMHAYCLHAAGHFEKAIAAHRRAAAYPGFRPAATYNLGCAQARLGRIDDAFMSLETAAQLGTLDVRQYASDPDLAALREDPRWPMFIARVEGMATNPADEAMHFWLGEWDVYDRVTGAEAGTNSITLRDNGRVIYESWTAASGGGGESFNYFEPISRTWKQVWVDGTGNVIEMGGVFADGSLRLEGRELYRNGTTATHRTTLTPQDDGRVRQFIESSRDGGLTWSTTYDLVYVPKGRPFRPDAAAAPSPGEGKVPRYDARTFYETVSISGVSFSADETRLLITSDATGVFNAYSLPVDGGAPTALTHSTTNSVRAVDWFPDDDRILFTMDEGGNELSHLYVRAIDGGVQDLTPGENLKAGFAGWTDDGSAFFVSTNERDEQHFDVYRYAADDYADRRLVFENPGGFLLSGISRDGRWIALNKMRSNADNDLYLFEITEPGEPGEPGAAPKHITPHEGRVVHSAEDFTPDGRGLYYTSNVDSEVQRLWAYDIERGTSRLVAEEAWDIMYCSFSRTGRYRIIGINEDARTRVGIVETKTGRPLALPAVPRGDVTEVTISDSGRYLACYVNGSTYPSNLFIQDLGEGGHRRLTDSLNPGIDERHLVEGEVVRYPSFDDLEIPAILYRPHEASADNPVPALVWVHGGPGGQSRIGYNPVVQLLANHGYAVLAVNNRGSSGYGKTFFHLDDRRHGDDDLRDCVWGRTYLAEQPWIRDDQIGIIGGSYGGYMVAAALAFEPDAFDVGIDIFGVTNWVRTLESIPPWWADIREALHAEMGDPATDRERLERISPLFHASNIRRPLLVVQGANDPRVLKIESDELVEAVRGNGVPVEYVVFDNEGHGFRRRDNRITAASAYLDFLDRYLRRD